MALKEGVDRDAVDTLRQGGVPTDPRLGPLNNFARAMVRNRGCIDPPTLHAFLAAGVLEAAGARRCDGNGVLTDGQLRKPLDASTARQLSQTVQLDALSEAYRTYQRGNCGCTWLRHNGDYGVRTCTRTR
jgi:hypothetical protein